MSLIEPRGLKRPRLLAVLALLAVTAAAPPAPRLLLPLSEKDHYSIKESGCEFSFGPANASLVYTINQTLMIRTAPGKAGLAKCKVRETAMSAFHDTGGKLSCGGLELSIRRTGRGTSSIEADSSSWPAALTIRNISNKRRQVLHGTAGVAC